MRYINPDDIRTYAKHMDMDLDIKEGERFDKKTGKNILYLKWRCKVPKGVLIDGVATDVFSSEISGDIEGDKKKVAHFLCVYLASVLRQLKPQVDCGAIIAMPELELPTLREKLN